MVLFREINYNKSDTGVQSLALLPHSKRLLDLMRLVFFIFLSQYFIVGGN